ncbi:MAG: trehalose utilization protein ThuA, partial [Rhodobacteraceae bacterium]|nr:trehalose utilization protein ThuA [Paracoccaceae bacterium]
MIRVTVWGENVHERENAVVAGVYPDGMHNTIAAALNRDAGVRAESVVLQDPDHGLSPARLADTDVLIWWGHAAHGAVDDAVVERVCDAVWGGMGII